MGEVAAEVRAGGPDEIQQHKEILEKTEHEEREVRGLVFHQKHMLKLGFDNNHFSKAFTLTLWLHATESLQRQKKANNK